VLGLTIGLAVAFLLETLMVAAQVFGMQAGYSYASTIDPTSGNDSNVLLVFAQLMGGLLFFALGVDRQVMRVFAMSLTAYPPGTFFLKPSAADAIVKLGAGMLSTGVRLALPVIVLLMLMDVALALLGRMQQQMQLLTLTFPAKMLATLAFLAAILVLFLPVYRAAAEHTISTLFRLL
jgi:flagellar biosynthetic protein FliR